VGRRPAAILCTAPVTIGVSIRGVNTVWGTNETFGRSYHLDNYQQVLSDALIDAANNLL
jgi:hypothetical protein